jgi:hypothetical protein
MVSLTLLLNHEAQWRSQGDGMMLSKQMGLIKIWAQKIYSYRESS